MSPYRGGELAELTCPRCKKKLPPLDVATCACGGVWVTAFASTEVLSADELRADPVTRWWRVREPCPQCGDKMILRGQEPGLFQGCDLHGYFIDADTVENTRLARGIDHAALDRKRQDHGRVEAEREAREAAALQRAKERAEIERREAELRTVGYVRESSPRVDPAQIRKAQRELLFTTHLRTVLGDGVAEMLLRRIAELEERVTELERQHSSKSVSGYWWSEDD